MDADDLKKLGFPDPALFERLIFVVGPAHSGTSLVTRSLLAHPDIVPSFRQESLFFEHIWRYRDRVDDFLFRRLVRALLLPPVAALADEKGTDGDRKRILTRLTREAIRDRSLTDIYKLYPVFSALLGARSKRINEGKRWLDKSTTWRGVRLVGEHFPDARMLFVFRDPRDTVLSQARRLARETGRDDAPVIDDGQLLVQSLYWRTLARLCLTARSKWPDRVTVVLYEDFVNKPEEVVEALLHRLQLSGVPEEAIRDALAAISSRAVFEQGQRYQGVTSETVGRWRKVLTEPQAAIITMITSGTAKELGYDLGDVPIVPGLVPILSALANPRPWPRIAYDLCFPAWNRRA